MRRHGKCLTGYDGYGRTVPESFLGLVNLVLVVEVLCAVESVSGTSCDSYEFYGRQIGGPVLACYVERYFERKPDDVACFVTRRLTVLKHDGFIVYEIEICWAAWIEYIVAFFLAFHSFNEPLVGLVVGFLNVGGSLHE